MVLSHCDFRYTINVYQAGSTQRHKPRVVLALCCGKGRAIANLELVGEAPTEKKSTPSPTKSGHFSFKIVIKNKLKLLEINLKRQSTDVTHSLQCALKFYSDHVMSDLIAS